MRTNLARVCIFRGRYIRMVDGCVRVSGSGFPHSLPHPFQIREGVLRRHRNGIHPVAFSHNFLSFLLGALGSQMWLIYPGGPLHRSRLHHLLILFKVLVDFSRFAITLIVELRLSILFVNWKGGFAEVRRQGIDIKPSTFRWSPFFIPNSLTTMSSGKNTEDVGTFCRNANNSRQRPRRLSA